MYLSRNLRTASLTVSPLSSARSRARSHNGSGTRITRRTIGIFGMGQAYRAVQTNVQTNRQEDET